MPHTAQISSTWRNRQLLLTAFLVGFGLWFFYDGWVGYPAHNVQVREYQRLKEEGRLEEWPQVAAEHRWRQKDPGKLHEPEDIAMQFVMGGLSTLLGLSALGWLLINSRRGLRSDEQAIYGEKGQRVPFDAIRRVDKKKWDNKGIAVAIYEMNGRQGKLVIDDYKFAGGEDILREVEERLGPGGGEAPPPAE